MLNGWTAPRVMQQEQRFSAPYVCLFVLINNKASHIATFFSALVPYTETGLSLHKLCSASGYA
jgi:hypothetical protein